MKFHFKIIYFIGLLFAATACEKKETDMVPACDGECTIISGRLTTGNGTIPLPNMDLTLEWKNTQYLAGGTIRKKAVATTDANGFYELKCKVRDDEMLEGYFNVEIAKPKGDYLLFPDGSNGGHSFWFYDLARDTTININYFIPPKAFVEVRLANPGQTKPGDYFATDFKMKMGVNGKTNYGPVVTWSSSLPLNPVLGVAAEQPIIVKSHKTKDGIKTVAYDTLYLAPGQKTIFTAEF